MNKVLRSPFIKAVVLIIGYLVALSTVLARSVYAGFISSYYADIPLMRLSIALPMLFICIGVFCISVWNSKANKVCQYLHKVDFILLIILVACVEYVCVYRAVFFSYSSLALLVVSVVSYAIGMLLVGETVARVRDKALMRSMYWMSFFKLYPPQRSAGLSVMLLLAGILWVIVILFSASNLWGFYFTWAGLLASLSAVMLVLAALNYLCWFLVSLSAKYEQSNIEERLRAERLKTELITNVSHDIRTPLTAIISYVDLLKALPVERDDFKEYVSVLDKKSARLKTLTSDLVEASKAASGNVVIDKTRIDLAEIVGQVAGEFEDQFIERSLTLVFHQPSEQILVDTDSGHLFRVLENLFGNVAKYALSGTRVFVEIAEQDGKTALSIKNTSQAPIDYAPEALTEQFIRGDRSRQTDGSGLGLYIAKSLIELMAGRFEINATGDLFEARITF